MKKKLFILVILLAFVSTSFAWTGSHYFYTRPDGNDIDGATLNINSYCADLELTGYTYSTNPYAGAGVDLWANNGEFTYRYTRQNTSDQEYVYYRVATGPYDPTYFSSVLVIVETYNASASITLLWDAV